MWKYYLPASLGNKKVKREGREGRKDRGREGGRKTTWEAPVTELKFRRVSEKQETSTSKKFPNLNILFLAALQETRRSNSLLDKICYF